MIDEFERTLQYLKNIEHRFVVKTDPLTSAEYDALFHLSEWVVRSYTRFSDRVFNIATSEGQIVFELQPDLSAIANDETLRTQALKFRKFISLFDRLLGVPRDSGLVAVTENDRRIVEIIELFKDHGLDPTPLKIALQDSPTVYRLTLKSSTIQPLKSRVSIKEKIILILERIF